MGLKRISNDKRQMLILLLGPVILCLIFGFVAYRSPQEINVTVFVDQSQRSSSLELKETRQIMAAIDGSKVFSVSEIYSMSDALQHLNDGNTRAIITIEEGQDSLQAIEVTVDVTDPTIRQPMT